MLWIFLLQLINSVDGLSGAEHETLCVSNACFTLHLDRLSFAKARQSCVHNGGYLVTVRDPEEEGALRSLLSQIRGRRQDRALKLWIGLKLNRGSCVLADKTLRGLTWVSGEEDSHYSNWGEEPVSTCSERCVTVTSTLSDPNPLKWTAGPCKTAAFYACKFYFQGMCKPLALLGPGEVTYTAPFSQEPQRSDMKAFPLGTYASIVCSDQQTDTYSVCMGSGGVYRWTEPGPFCKAGLRSCAVGNGGCEHLCRQDGGEVRCLCREGHDLDEDGLSCRAKDSCGAATCEHECVAAESGYSCKCPRGFRLDEDRHSCSDIDECQTPACGDHVCANVLGGYTCACKDGYEMVGGECSDVDECAQPRCEHGCVNNAGSFSCHCNEGFALSPDGRSCADVDECAGGGGGCRFTCVNAAGSFRCTCPRGFYLEADGSTCAPAATETSAAPPDDATGEDFAGNLTGTTEELQHRSPGTDAPLPDPASVVTQAGRQGNASLAPSSVQPVNSRVLVCVLGSVVPLLALVAVTLAIAIFRCGRSKREAEKKATADGYCWVSSGLDPRLEKLYESILTDDL